MPNTCQNQLLHCHETHPLWPSSPISNRDPKTTTTVEAPGPPVGANRPGWAAQAYGPGGSPRPSNVSSCAPVKAEVLAAQLVATSRSRWGLTSG